MTTTTLTPGVDFGKRLTALMSWHGISNYVLCRETIRGHSVTRAYRRGAAFPKLDSLIDLAVFFRVSVDYLVCTSDEMLPNDVSPRSHLLCVNTFPSRLLRLRKERRLTQVDLARACRVTVVSIQNYEGCKNWPGYWTALELAKQLGVSLDYLVGFTDKK